MTIYVDDLLVAGTAYKPNWDSAFVPGTPSYGDDVLYVPPFPGFVVARITIDATAGSLVIAGVPASFRHREGIAASTGTLSIAGADVPIIGNTTSSTPPDSPPPSTPDPVVAPPAPTPPSRDVYIPRSGRMSATSQLEAVNTMLSCITASPVQTLEDTGDVDVAKAISVLDEVSREVQAKGWHWNTENDYPLIRNAQGYILLATDMIEVDTSKCLTQDYNVVQRGARLYWLNKHTYVFDKDLTGEVMFLLPWDELPQVARNYIMIRAARRFQGRELGSDTKYKFSENEEAQALAELNLSEANTGDYNMLTGSWSVNNILRR